MGVAAPVYTRTGGRFRPVALGFHPFTFAPRIMPDA